MTDSSLMPFFSVIVCVYNAEMSLRRCLDSIASQTYTDWECVLLDDGSTDGSAGICDEFAARTAGRFRVIHQANSGVGAARQAGINAAQGVFTLHVDSDDWVEPFMLADLRTFIEERGADLVFFDYWEKTPRGRELYRSLGLDAESDPAALVTSMLRGRLNSYIWFIAVRRSLYAAGNITFDRDLRYGEDTLAVLELLLLSPSVAYLPRGFYHYSFNSASITHTASREKHLERLKFLRNLDALLIRCHREDLRGGPGSFFTVDAKYEMLSDGLFTKKEYRTLLPFGEGIDKKQLLCYGHRKWILLTLAETGSYGLARFLARLIRLLRNLLK